jgi:hypothetical protein
LLELKAMGVIAKLVFRMKWISNLIFLAKDTIKYKTNRIESY